MMPPLSPPDWRDRIAGREVVVSVSGGKDSTAVCIALEAAGVPFRAVTMDTGWEAAETYEYLHGPWADRFGAPEVLRVGEPLPAGYEAAVLAIEAALGRESDMVRICVRKGMLPSRIRRWCTDELKVRPVRRYLQAVPGAVNAIGVRADESRSRADAEAWEPAPWDESVAVWRPLLRWTEADVIAAHADAGMLPNPLYLRGARRVGCWPCVMARKGEIAHIATRDPGRVRALAMLEALVTRVRVDRHGDARPAGWFQNPRPRRDADGRLYPGEGACWPIGRVVDWATTSDQLDLYGELYGDDASCMRWGLCEHPDDTTALEAP